MNPRDTTRRDTGPSYGIDSPYVVRNLLISGTVAIVAGLLVPPFHAWGFRISLVGPTLLSIGSLSLLLCALMLAYSLRGKFNIRERMLGMVAWRGDETVLDIGTGRGLLAIGAAKRLQTGSVTGIDIWKAGELSGNTLDNTQRNVEIEGVGDRVELRSDDMRSISFVNSSFDVILSLLCIHNIESAEERESACREIARVLKPRGVAIIADHTDTSEYAKALTNAGLTVETTQSYLFQSCLPVTIVLAKKLPPAKRQAA
jgi:arsenite methyltransferase